MYLATVGKTDLTLTLVLNVLALTFSTICTIWVGRWSAQREYKAFIRAALRTTYGLKEGLGAAEQSALQAVSRMKGRTVLSTDVASQFWEEVIGRVLDQLRGLMREAQATVANWHEFLPEEVDKLVTAEQEKATAIDELTLAAEQARAAVRELPKAEAAALNERIEALEQERSRLSTTSALAIPGTGEARKLLAAGAFEDAIAAYSSLIATSPGAHTLYVSRARARYLGGDSAGALEDLRAAEEKFPTDPSIARLRKEIQEGKKPSVVILPRSDWAEHAARGNNALAAGNGEGALKEYQTPREAGLIRVFADADEAMALLVMGKIDDAKKLIADSLPDTTGLFMRAQAFALIAVADALVEKDNSGAIRELGKCIDDLRVCGKQFVLSESPLQFLALGLRATNRLTETVRQVFRMLGNPDVLSIPSAGTKGAVQSGADDHPAGG